MTKRLLTRVSLSSNSLNIKTRETKLKNSICSKLHTNAIPTKEIRIPVPWGHISAKVWGDITKHRPILALHGWQDNAGTWDPLAPMLIKDRAIVAIDFPGHGLSSWIPPGMQYHNWDLTRHIIAIKEYFKLDKVALLGHSMGSVASLRFACMFPDDIELFVGVDNIIYDQNSILEEFPQLISKSATAQTRLDQEPPSYTMEEIEQKWHLSTEKSVNLENVKYLTKRGTQPSKIHPSKYYISRDSRLKYMMFIPEDKNFVEALIRRLRCPTLFIKSIHAPNARYSYSIEMCKIIEKSNSNFEKHLVPGTHYVHINNPELVAPLIFNFLKKYGTSELRRFT